MAKNNLQRVEKAHVLGSFVGLLIASIIGYVVFKRVLGRPIQLIEFDSIFVVLNSIFLGSVFLSGMKSKKERTKLIGAFVASMMVVVGLTVFVRHYVYGMPVLYIILMSIFSMLSYIGFFLFFSRKRTA